MRKTGFILIELFIVFVSSFATSMAQNMTATYDSINSKILKEKRIIEVSLPEIHKPGTTERYDVIYVTDGKWNMKVVSQKSGWSYQSEIPPV